VSDRLTRAENTSHQDIKKDALVTWAFHAGDWAQNNLRTIGIAAGIAVIAVLGSVWISRAQGRAEADANLVLAEASVSYWQGNYVRTIQLSDQVMSYIASSGLPLPVKGKGAAGAAGAAGQSLR